MNKAFNAIDCTVTERAMALLRKEAAHQWIQEYNSGYVLPVTEIVIGPGRRVIYRLQERGNSQVYIRSRSAPWAASYASQLSVTEMADVMKALAAWSPS